MWPPGGLAVRDGVEQRSGPAEPVALVPTVCDLDTPDEQTAPVHRRQSGTSGHRWGEIKIDNIWLKTWGL